jgi:D-glycero-D-manno-heptose 1,7-bisphosphate phosphatase
VDTERGAGSLSAVFLDRDGVINRKAPAGDYVKSWEEFAFLPGALDALRGLAESGTPAVIVTNQRGIARGRMSEGDLADIHARMLVEIDQAGGAIAAIHHCPHEGGCACRKPGVELFERAARDLGLELRATAVVGDGPADMEAARRIGALQVFVRGNATSPPGVDHEADSLLDAVRWLSGRGAD